MRGRQDPYENTASALMQTCVGLITYGSPLPPYGLAHGKQKKIQFPHPSLIDTFKGKAKWLNHFRANDPLGRPLDNDFVDSIDNIDLSETLEIPLVSHMDYERDGTFIEYSSIYKRDFECILIEY